MLGRVGDGLCVGLGGGRRGGLVAVANASVGRARGVKVCVAVFVGIGVKVIVGVAVGFKA